MNAVRYWTIFSLGVTAGATVALLCAPQSGARTRRQIKRNLEDAGNSVKDLYDNGCDAMQDAASRVRDAAKSLSEKVS